jgi:uncharacterized membrane protein YphA (DoxX/SURF4 family)
MTIEKVVTFNRLFLFIIYFWFGILKLFNLSPANPLVSALLEKTLPFIPAQTFFVVLGIFEVIISILFLSTKFTKVLVGSVCLHLVTTFMPLILLPSIAWQSFMIPTIEGQYIIKNLLIILGLVNLTFLSKTLKQN